MDFDRRTEYFQKPLFDLMHDCPAHESMEHQVESLFRRRFLLLTDYAYVGVAKALGVRHARFVPSIAFPTTLPDPPRKLRDRSIEILLPMGFQAPEISRHRHSNVSYRRRIYRESSRPWSRRASPTCSLIRCMR